MILSISKKLSIFFLLSFAISIRCQLVPQGNRQGPGFDQAANKPLQRGDKLRVNDDNDQNESNAAAANRDHDRSKTGDQQNNRFNPPADQPIPVQPNQNPNPNQIQNQQAPRIPPPMEQAVPKLERRPPPQSMAGDHLADRLECSQEVAKYCSKVPRQSDVAILQCLQDSGDKDDSLTEQCQHLLWEFKVNLTMDERFRKAAEEFCQDYLNDECGKVTAIRGHMISCLADKKDTMQDGHCKSFLTRMEAVVFTDFRLVGPFVQACTADVKKWNCGQLDDDRLTKVNTEAPHPGQPGQPQQPQARIPHSQGATLDCLIRKLIESGQGDKNLDPLCRHQIIRIAELQADDFHLDRPLFFACRDDREKFCATVTAGDGRIFHCLVERRYQNDMAMSSECQKTLDVRLQLMGKDYKISKQLLQGCKQEMQQYNCEFKPNDPKLSAPPEHMYLAYLILCLEDAGRKENTRFSQQCQKQIFEHRRLLMSDYRMDPEIVLTCSADISKYCEKFEDGGRTLHCLMNQARKRKTDMDSMCKQAIIKLMEVANVAEDYRVDRVLYMDCRRLIDSACQKQITSQSDVLSCLMMNVESPLMTEDCENRLLEVQYFLARDYKLDPQLFHACKEDAASKCGDKGNWVDVNKAVVPAPPLDSQQQQQKSNKDPKALEPGAERGYLVMTCLYRHLYDDDETLKPSPKCSKEVQRVMRERSMSVNLMPHIEDACLSELAEKCSQKTAPGEEMRCLQDNLKDLGAPCKKEVQEFTEQESMDTRLDHALMRACSPVLETNCKDSLDKAIDKGDILDCLLKNKGVPAMNSKCRTFVNHYELISMKDYKFTYKFRQACKADIERNCLQQGAATDKASIVGCLSEIVVKHALLGGQEQIAKECRKQLRAEYFSLEAVETKIGDPKLIGACESDIKRYCDKADNAAQALECLREHKPELEPRCRKYIFKKEKLEFQDNSFDLILNRVCADEIRSLCAHEQPERVLHCLKTKIEREGVQKSFECLDLVRKRRREQAGDIRLQPLLARACDQELKTLCKNEYDNIKKEEEAEGVVIGCLRRFVTSHQKGVVVSAGCQQEVRRIIYDSEIDPSLDPPFYRHCKEEIMTKCSQQLMAKDDHQSILECMKAGYKKHSITKPACAKEIARKINEELADIHLDPELNVACATDLQHFCEDVRAGDGKLLNCLLEASKSGNVRLSQQCQSKLSDREQLWKQVKSDNYQINMPADVGSVLAAVYGSPVRNTLATVLFVIVVVIFAMGLCCGRVTRRIRREVKNR